MIRRAFSTLTHPLFFVLMGTSAAHAWDGSDGSSGSDGRRGASGPSYVVRAQGQAYDLNLSGFNGGNGSPGSDGTDAGSCSFFQGSSDVSLDDGGNGGNGGDGGRGGDAGDLTIHYADPLALRNVRVVSEPGRGGRGSYGGQGARGCRCWPSSWTSTQWRTFIDPKTGKSCSEPVIYTHYCRDGSDGRDGSHGSDGSNGSSSSFTLIPQLEDLAPETTSARVPLTEINAPHPLSGNYFETRQGLQDWLAPGSELSTNAYRLFIKRVQSTARFTWAARRAPSEFPQAYFSIQLSMPNGAISAAPDSSVLMRLASQNDGPVTTFTVLEALPSSEVTQLAISGLRNEGEALELLVSEAQGLADTGVKTRFELSITAKSWFLGWKKERFHGTVEARREGNQFVIPLGRLGIPPKFLQPGDKFDLTLEVTRSLGEQSRQVTLQGRYQAPKRQR